jgi:hypothetical protein
MRSSSARTALWLLLCLHAALLLASLGDYRVSSDSGYHVALARVYASEGSAWWDPVNYGPGGRPNLQGPLLHVAIASVGTVLGGTGDDFVLANAMLAVLQWGAAVATIVFFARRLDGELAALFAASLFTGSVFAAGSFYVGIPSGWLFVLTPWAIHFFLEKRLVLSALATSSAIYAHLGGYMTTPLGVTVAALLTQRWRDLLFVGAGVAILTAPFTQHVVRHLDWYLGKRGHVALLFDPLIQIVGAAGALAVLRRPRENVFLVAWLAAPAAWLVQDPTRFLLQWSLAASVAAGILLARAALHVSRPRLRAGLCIGFVALATLFPLGLPSLGAEALWLFGLRYPRNLDWVERRELAGIVQQAEPHGRLVSAYDPSLCTSLAVYAKLQCEKGHWVEVQPRPDPADDLLAASKLYVVPVPPGDPVLTSWASQNLLRIHGGSGRTAIVSLAEIDPPDGSDAPEILASSALWLAEHAVNNRLGTPDQILSATWLVERRRQALAQRTEAGRMMLAALLLAGELEPRDSQAGYDMRQSARIFGAIATFLGEESSIDFIDDPRHERLRENLRAVATEARSVTRSGASPARLLEAIERLRSDYFWAA